MVSPLASESQEDAGSDNEQDDTLFIPQSVLETHPSLAHLLDDFEESDSDVFAQVSLVQPPLLTKVILHQVSSENSADDADEAKKVLAELAGGESPADGDKGGKSKPVMVQQDTHWTCACNGKTYVVLLAIPFTQGVISPSTTEVIISTPSASAPTTHQNGMAGPSSTSSSLVDRLALSSSLQHKNLLFAGAARSSATRSTRQQRAMLNFSTDGFLSASLVVDPARERREAGRKRKVAMKGLLSSEGIDELEEEDEDEDDDPFWDDELDDDHPSSDDGGDDTDVLLGTRHSSSVGSSLSESSGSITPRPHLYPDPPLPQTIPGDVDGEADTQEADSRPMINGAAAPDKPDGIRNGREKGKETEEQDIFRGFAFEPFPLRRRPLSASTRFREREIASGGKGKGREDAEQFGMNGMELAGGTEWPDDEAVVWLSLKGLARAGVFVGDWVSSFDPCSTCQCQRLIF